MTDTYTPTASAVDFSTHGRYELPPSAFIKVNGETSVNYPIGGRLSYDGSNRGAAVHM